jgi:hypothetical protein
VGLEKDEEGSKKGSSKVQFGYHRLCVHVFTRPKRIDKNVDGGACAFAAPPANMLFGW